MADDFTFATRTTAASGACPVCHNPVAGDAVRFTKEIGVRPFKKTFNIDFHDGCAGRLAEHILHLLPSSGLSGGSRAP